MSQENPARRRVIAGTAGATLAASVGYAHLVYHRRRHSVSGAVLRLALRGAWREALATARDQRVRARDFVFRR
jgi:hypothetical protein